MITGALNKCPICGERVDLIAHSPGGTYDLDCVRCGKYKIGGIAAGEISNWTKEQRINLSGWVRENPNIEIVSSNLKQFARLPSLSVGEKAEKILLQLAKRFPIPGEIHDLSRGAHLEFMAVGRLEKPSELHFFIRDYLCGEMDFLIRHELVTELGDDSRYSISPKGWAYIESFRHGNRESERGFIAMSFDNSLISIHIAIENGIREAGYKAFRVDQKEHNNDITDEIIAGIRSSKFMVADLTGNRPNVYYEAGFAKGLGIKVIWLCRKDHEKERHFDIRQLNCIFWEEDKLSELTKALKNRIEASNIGRGPLPTETPK